MLLEVVVAYFQKPQNICEGTEDNKEIARSITTTEKVKVKLPLSTP